MPAPALPTLTVPLATIDHVLGPAHARVAVIEYGDFECPSCAAVFPAVKILQRHFDGRIRFAYRHYPIVEQHPHAEMAAEAAEAAAAQHKFWPLHDRLFEHHDRLTSHTLREHAQAVGLDLHRYDAEMGDRIYLQRVNEQREGARASGVRGTPAFFVDGVLVDASYGMQHVMDAVEAALR